MVPLLGLLMLLRVHSTWLKSLLVAALLVLVAEWSLPDGFDADVVAARMPDAPEVWSDGSLVLDSVTGVSSSGAGFFAHQSEHCWSSRWWGHVVGVRRGGEVLM